MAPLHRQPGLTEVIAVALAWLVPGAGHLYLGRRFRGLLILAATLGTFWGGIAIGGIMTVDVRTERWWFAADMLTGMHGLAGWQMSEAVNRRVDGELMQNPDYDRGLRNRRMRVINASKENDKEAAQADLAQYRNEHAAEVLARDGLALVSPLDTVARAYCGIAGLLNLMCIFDALLLARIGYRNEGLEGADAPEPTGP